MVPLKTALPLAAALLLAVPATAAAEFIHTVEPGESLSSVAAVDGLSVEQLAAANGLSPTAELIAGSGLAIPPQIEAEATVAAPEATAGTPEDAAAAAPSVAEDGDCDSDDSGCAGVSPEQVISSNASSPAISQPEGAAAEAPSGGPPYPTAETVTPAQVSEIAAANGVSPSFANAIADEESGFNNGLTSSANAVGVMQIMPGTWSYINEQLAGESPLTPTSALENVRGGVMLLHSLLEATGGNETLAAAGYYQGLPSVLHNGVEPGTQQYTEDVQALQQQFGG
jgi:N-acetylmuramoyl-L-alanine amidase